MGRWRKAAGGKIKYLLWCVMLINGGVVLLTTNIAFKIK